MGELSVETKVLHARRGLAVFFAVLLPLTALIERSLIVEGMSAAKVFALMWVPAVASLVARLVMRESLADVSFRWGGTRTTRLAVLACALPMVICFAAYPLGWLTGLVGFREPISTDFHRYVELQPFLASGELALSGPPLVKFMSKLLIDTTLGTGLGVVWCLGEELGWRGFMLVHLIDARVRRPVLMSGLVWAAWHAPLIISGEYAQGGSPLVSLLLFCVVLLPGTYVYSRLRLESGSIWPPVLLHASWNATVQGVFDAASTLPSIWVGESGVFVVVAASVAVWVIARGEWSFRRAPQRASEGELRAATM